MEGPQEGRAIGEGIRGKRQRRGERGKMRKGRTASEIGESYRSEEGHVCEGGTQTPHLDPPKTDPLLPAQ
eukprot:2781111-Pyramimonas_sp.AAC.1